MTAVPTGEIRALTRLLRVFAALILGQLTTQV
jgi:hypothetical protein